MNQRVLSRRASLRIDTLRKLLITAAIVVVLGASAFAFLVYQLWNVPDGSDTPSTGWSAIGVGDVDADGCDDLALTTRFDPVTEDDVPTTWIVSGRSGDPLFTVRADDSLLDERKFGTYGRGRHEVRRLGDLNEDGRAEIGFQVGDFHARRRMRTTVVSGPDGRVALEKLPSGDDWKSTMCALGDVDGDGHRDLVMTTGGTRARATLVSGVDGHEILRVDEVRGPPSPNGTHDNTGFGFALAAPGNLDDDVVPDFVVGSLFHAQLDAFSGADGRRLWSASFGGLLVGELRSIGDFDGDGVRDLVATVDLGYGMRPDRVVSGRDGSQIATTSDLRECDFVGDVDGDEKMDFAGLRSAHSNRHAVVDHQLVIASGATFADISVTQLGSTWPWLLKCRAVGDINGDGVLDVALIENRHLVVDGRNWVPAFGTVTIRSGKDGSVLHTIDRDALVRLAARDFPRIVIR